MLRLALDDRQFPANHSLVSGKLNSPRLSCVIKSTQLLMVFVLAITCRVTELLIFYFVNQQYGESWTNYSYLQIAGLTVLLYGTAIYNGPNGGGLRLEGQWWVLGINLSYEYDAILHENEVKAEAEVGEYLRIV